MGNTFGRRGDVALQRRILNDALELLCSCEEGGTQVDLPYQWHEPVAYKPKKRDPSYQRND